MPRTRRDGGKNLSGRCKETDAWDTGDGWLRFTKRLSDRRAGGVINLARDLYSLVPASDLPLVWQGAA